MPSVRSSARALLQALDARWFVFAVSAGIVARIALGWYVGPLTSDPLAYHQMAIKLLHGEAFVPFFPPGAPYFLAGLYRVVGESELAARAAGLLWYVGLSSLLYRFTTLVSTRAAANLAVILFAIFPAFLWHSVEPRTELPTATLLLLVGYLTVLDLRAPRWWRHALLGLVLGFTVLTRPSSMLLVGVIPVFIAMVTRRVWSAVLPVAVCAVLVGAWLVKAHDMAGRFVMINDANSVNLFLGNNEYTPLYRTWWFGSHAAGDPSVPTEFTALMEGIEARPAAERNQLYREVAIDHIKARPDLFVVRTANRVRVFFGFDTSTGSYMRKKYGASTPVALMLIALDALLYCSIAIASLFFLFTFTGAAGRPTRDEVRAILLVALCYSIPYWFSFSHPTYHFPIVPLLAISGVSFIERFANEPPESVMAPIRESPRRRYGLVTALVVFALIQVEWILFGLSRI